jgi:hypothetical protein
MIDENNMIFEVVDRHYGVLLRVTVVQLMTIGLSMPMKWVLSQDTIFRIIEEKT